ncbi:hypothetical protein B0H14DRAFT_2605233 [Mycena olivaceomarginata]|nr:hypothetical protein B0H14DRAFT_2605233 [Mycena olivaceomarginata]
MLNLTIACCAYLVAFTLSLLADDLGRTRKRPMFAQTSSTLGEADDLVARVGGAASTRRQRALQDVDAASRRYSWLTNGTGGPFHDICGIRQIIPPFSGVERPSQDPISCTLGEADDPVARVGGAASTRRQRALQDLWMRPAGPEEIRLIIPPFSEWSDRLKNYTWTGWPTPAVLSLACRFRRSARFATGGRAAVLPLPSTPTDRTVHKSYGSRMTDGAWWNNPTQSTSDLAPTSTPAHFQEDLDTNNALDAQDFSYAMGDTSLPAEEGAADGDGISVRVRAKRYENSRGQPKYILRVLHAARPTRGTVDLTRPSGVEWVVLQTYWALNTWLGRTGWATPRGRRAQRCDAACYKFTLIDLNGIHNVAVQFCQCDSRIEHRQQLMRPGEDIGIPFSAFVGTPDEQQMA